MISLFTFKVTVYHIYAAKIIIYFNQPHYPPHFNIIYILRLKSSWWGLHVSLWNRVNSKNF